MVNLGLNWSSLLGIILAVAGAGLYFLRTWKPKLARDHDIFFAAVGLLCGGILLFQGWRLDPILAFGQFLLTGSAVFFAVESINLRGATTAQAKSRTQYVDEERPVSRQYSYVEAELDELEPVEEYPVNRRLRGNQEPRSVRDTYEEEPRRRPSSRNNPPAKPDSGTRPSKRPTRVEGRSERSDDWDVSEDRTEKPIRSRGDRPPTSEMRDSDTPTRPKRNRPPQESRSRRSSSQAGSPSEDYVEYRPVDYPEDGSDSSTNFDQ